MAAPKNTWHCSICDFYVFNTKQKCDKCLTQKPKPKCLTQPKYNTSYDPCFDKTVCEYFQTKLLEEKTSCTKCKNEGRIYNKEPMMSNHNCWKYS